MLDRSSIVSASGVAHEADTATAGSEVVFAVRDEAERRGIRLSYETLIQTVGGNAELYRRAMANGSVFSGDHLMPPSVLRVCERIRNEFPQLGPVSAR